MKSNNKTAAGYLPYIDGLRAIAVLSVVFFHMEIEGFGGGFVGVDVFFVISGFLITRLILKELDETGRFSITNFYWRRLRRLMPAFLLTVTFTALVMGLILSPMYLAKFGRSLVAACLGISNFSFWIEADYFDTASRFKPLLHTWSLGVEEQFYLVWPLLLLAAYIAKLKRYLPALLLLAGGISLWLNYMFADGYSTLVRVFPVSWQELFDDGKTTIFFLIPFRVFEFVIGGLMVWGVHRVPVSRFAREAMFLAGLAAVLYSVCAFDEDLLFPMASALVPCVGSALLIGVGDKSRLSFLLDNRFMVFIGLISYSFYLVHWPVIVAWFYLVGKPGIAAVLGLTGVSILLAWLSWRFWERPLRGERFWVHHPRRVAMLGLLYLAVVAAGYSMSRDKGWEFRVRTSDVRLDPLDETTDYHRQHYGGAGYPKDRGVDTEAPADIVLLGDSHARQYAEGLYEELARPRGLALYVSRGFSCFHLPGFTRTTTGVDWNRLAPRALEWGLGVVDAAERPPVVFLAHAWLWQKGVGGLMDDAGNLYDDTLTTEDIVRGILELKHRLGDAQLVVIGQVPTTNEIDLYDIFTRPDFVRRYFTDTRKYRMSQPLKEYLDLNDALRNAAKESGAFTFLDPFDVLCGEAGCRNLDDEQRLMYSDLTHLSKAGSRFVIRHFMPQIEELLDGRMP